MLATPPRNIFVTGATGFLGSHFVTEYLRTDPANIFALVRDQSPHPPTARLTAALAAAQTANATAHPIPAHSLTAIPGDITHPLAGLSPETLTHLRQSHIDTFWHFASDLRFEPRNSAETRRINVDGARHALALAAAIGVKRFIYISTAFVCGRQSGLIPETLVPTLTPPHRQFNNVYEATKSEAEHLLTAECDRLHLPLTILRPSIVIGPRSTQSALGSDTGLFALIQAVLWIRSSPTAQASTLRIPASPDAEINFIPVDAVVSDMLALARSNFARPTGTAASIHHLTSTSSISVAQCWRTISDAVGMHNIALVPRNSFDPTPAERLIARRIGFFLSYIDTDRRFHRSLTPARTLTPADFTGYVRQAIDRVHLETTHKASARHAG